MPSPLFHPLHYLSNLLWQHIEGGILQLHLGERQADVLRIQIGSEKMPSTCRDPLAKFCIAMWLEILAIVGGIMLLVMAADRFVANSAALARSLGVPTLIIGLTVVGLGTSAPEIVVSSTAVLSGASGLAVGNAIGSNIANLGLILGVTSLIVPLQVHSSLLQREYPLVLGVSLLVLGLLADQYLGYGDAAILLILFIAITLWMIHLAIQGADGDPLERELEQEIPKNPRIGRTLLWIGASLGLLLLGAQILVWGAVGIARAIGMSELTIGLTIIAVGTSLPELATSVTGALKGEDDIAVGNVLGSNLYNLLTVLSLPGLIAPGPVSLDVVTRDLPLMLGLTVAVMLISHPRLSPRRRIGRLGGALLLSCFILYQGWLYMTAIAPSL